MGASRAWQYLLLRFQALQRLVHIDLSPGHLLHELETRCRGWDRCALDAELREQRVEARPRGRVAHTQVPLELFHVAPRGEKHTKHFPVFIAQDAELARRERAGQLGLARRACESSHGETRAADGAAGWWPAGGDARHHATSTRTLPIRQSMSSVPAPAPTMRSLTASPTMATSPIVVWALIRTLDVLASATRTSPILQRIALVPPSSRPEAVMLPAMTFRSIGPQNSLMWQLPALMSPVTAPLTPLVVWIPALALAVSAIERFIRPVGLPAGSEAGMLLPD